MGFFSTVAGGNLNVADATGSTIAGGNGNKIRDQAYYSVIGGGLFNTIATGAEGSVIAGGVANTNAARFSSLGGGVDNKIEEHAWHSVIAGGKLNRARTNAAYAVIPGGFANIVDAPHTFAAGYNAHALHHGAFVWSDTSNFAFDSATSNEFAVRASLAGGSESPVVPKAIALLQLQSRDYAVATIP